MDKILIVLNDAILLTTFKIRMHSHASNTQDIILAKDSLEAVDILKENTITLLVTDLSTSGGDSFKMLVYVAKQHHQMSVVVVSDLATSNLGSSATIHCVNKPKSQRDLGLLTETSTSGAQLKTAGNMLVRDFFQLIEITEKTCLLEIGGPNIKGLVYFYQGVLFDSFCLQYGHHKQISHVRGRVGGHRMSGAQSVHAPSATAGCDKRCHAARAFRYMEQWFFRTTHTILQPDEPTTPLLLPDNTPPVRANTRRPASQLANGSPQTQRPNCGSHLLLLPPIRAINPRFPIFRTYGGKAQTQVPPTPFARNSSHYDRIPRL